MKWDMARALRVFIRWFLLSFLTWMVLSVGMLNASPLSATVWADEEFQVYISTSEVVDGALFLEGNGGVEDAQTAEVQLVEGVTNYLHVRVKNEGGDACAMIGSFTVGDTFIFSNLSRTTTTLVDHSHWRMSREGFGPPYDYIQDLGSNGASPWGSQDIPAVFVNYIGSEEGAGDHYFSLAISPTNIDTPGSRFQYIITPEEGSQEGRLQQVVGLPIVGLLDDGDDQAMSVPDPGRVGVRLGDSISGVVGNEFTSVVSEMDLSDFVVTSAGNETSVDVSLNLRLKGNLTAGAGDLLSTVENSSASTTLLLLIQVAQKGNKLFTTSDVSYEAIHRVGGDNPESKVTSEGEFGLGILGFLQPILPAEPDGDAGEFVSEFNLDIDEPMTSSTFTVETGVPFSVRLYFEATTKVVSDGGRAMADIQFTGGWSFPYDGPVFNVPDGFTVNALSASVTDNRFENGAGSSGEETDKLLVPGLFMHAGDIAGESKAKGHEDWIDLLDVSSGLVRLRQGFNGSPASHLDVGVIKTMDKSSPKLMEAISDGNLFEEVVIEHTVELSKDKWSQFEIRLQNAIAVNYELLKQGDELLPVEFFSFNYDKIDWIYRICDSDGNSQGRVEAFWDLSTNTGGSSSSSEDNQPPGIDPVANQNVDPASSNTVDVTFGDGETDADDLVVTVSTSRPDLIGDLSITGAGDNRRIHYKTSAFRSGFASISVTVSDGKDSRTTAVPVLIGVEMTPFEGFLAAYFTEEEMFNPQMASPILDPDKDGILTVIEYLLGTNPIEYNRASEAMKVAFNLDGEDCNCTLDFKKRLDDPNIQGHFWVSENLKDWTRMDNANPLYEETVTEGQNPLFGQARATIAFPDLCEEPKFIRFQVQDIF